MFQSIKVDCKAGYSDAVGDAGEKSVRCTTSGYTGYIRSCVEGCDYPLTDGAHTLSVQPNYEIGYAYYPASDNTAITVKCAEGKQTTFDKNLGRIWNLKTFPNMFR